MKTFIFSALALGMMASCSNTEVEGIDAVDNGEPVAIQLSAGVETNVVAGLTRAAITGDATFTAKILGWEDAAAYTADPSWSSTASGIKASGKTDKLQLAAPQYYLANGKSTKMKAFYPGDATINATNKYIYDFTNTDGQTDVLMATEVVGNKNLASPVEFQFTHPLTQLKFKLVAGAGFPDGVTVSSIKVNGVKLPVGIDVSTDAVVYDNTSTPLAVPAISAETSVAVGNESAAPVGNPIMVAPIENGKFTVDITASGNRNYQGINVQLDGVTGDVTGAGIAYVVTLTFKEKISASSDVTDWTDGTGSGTVE